MRTLSPFQILPSHVVELIVDHVVGSSRLQFDGVADSSEAYAVLLLPLLSVCRDFRAVVLARYCKIHSLDLTCFSDQGNDKMTLWPEWLRDIGFPTHLHAQELDITLGVFSVYNGATLNELLREPHSDFLFPMVRSLKVTLTRTTKEQRLLASSPAAQDIEPNIRAFVQRIRQMAPMTRNVCISLQSRSNNESQFAVQNFSSLVAQLSQLGDTVEHNYNCRPLRLEPPPTDIRSLVHMDCSESDGDLLMQLARHNAPTLQTLKIYVGETESISKLIQNVDGSYVQFPHLRVLKIQQKSGWFSPQKPTFFGAIPFPSLRHLSLSGSFSFGDNTPFRGNADTLEYLYLSLCPGVIGVLKERQVFTHGSHSKLQCAKLGLASVRPHGQFDTDVSFMQFVLSIGSNACVREFNSWLVSLPLRFVIPLLGECTRIQVLALPYTAMYIWDVFSLVKALPLLTDLHTRFSKPEAWLSDISDQHLPAHVIANYAPMGERFRCWQFAEFNDAEAKMAVKCVLLLALVCPNFDYAAVSADCRELFMAHMKKTISSNGYRQHATRLRRLLFGGWKDEIPSVSTLQAIS
ncbi:hypothetical protein GGI09_000542 [Coemansia sp. S100]|nr:hypothetical protein LPJ71_000128 [Coemansia sp. S17]KAJ2103659.1 hypothetical protein GGI09_000542 [Coemansia sp. S100]